MNLPNFDSEIFEEITGIKTTPKTNPIKHQGYGIPGVSKVSFCKQAKGKVLRMTYREMFEKLSEEQLDMDIVILYDRFGFYDGKLEFANNTPYIGIEDLVDDVEEYT